MKAIKIGPDAPRWKSMGSVWPGARYWFPDMAVQTFREQERLSGYDLIEEIPVEINLRLWRGEDRGTMLIYNTGKIGDQLWTSGLIHELKRLHPRLEIDVVSGPESDYMWTRNPDIRSIRLTPLPIDAFDIYDFVHVFDETFARRMDAEQPDCYHALFDQLELRVPDHVKPHVRPTHTDELSAYHTLMEPDENGLIYRTRGHFVVGLHSSSAVKNLPAETMLNFVAMLAASTTNRVYCLSNDDFGAGISERLALLPNVITAHDKLNVLQIAALCRYATCVISADSMLVHLAASQDAPTVAMLSTIGPRYLTNNYPFCVPIWNKSSCPYGDCFYRRSRFQYQLGEISESSKCYTPARTSCDVMQSITVEQIFEAINLAINRKNENGGFNQNDLPME